jgi:transcriptional regulator with XRE-family HTH domain
MYFHIVSPIFLLELRLMSIHTDEVLLKLIGKRIREIRTLRKMSQKDVAFKIGMETSNFSVIETGKSNPQVLTYAKIAAALDVDLRLFFDFEPPFDYRAFGEEPGTYSPRKHVKQ